MGKIRIFDTTLRDGEQQPGISFSVGQKVRLARALDEAGVDVIEAGYPANGEEECAAVSGVAASTRAVTCALARVIADDIEAAAACGAGMIHVFCSASRVQLKASMQKSQAQALEMSWEAVQRVKDHGLACMFSPMDSTRAEPGFLLEMCQQAKEAGADIINLADTVGIALPKAMASLVGRVRREVGLPVSVHCHNDFGLATAVSLAAVEAGAEMVQVCLSGMGERAGNADLAQVVMGLKCLLGRASNFRTEHLGRLAELLAGIGGITPAPNSPVIGQNAFSHESGIHVAAAQRDPAAFEPGIMTPEMVGARRALVLGKHSGRWAVNQALREMGMDLEHDVITAITQRVRLLGSRQGRVSPEELAGMALEGIGPAPGGKMA